MKVSMISIEHHIFTEDGCKLIADLDINSDKTLTHKLRWQSFSGKFNFETVDKYYRIVTKARKHPIFAAEDCRVMTQDGWKLVRDLVLKEDRLGYNYTISCVDQHDRSPRFDTYFSEEAVFNIMIKKLELIEGKKDMICFEISGENSFSIDGLLIGGV